MANWMKWTINFSHFGVQKLIKWLLIACFLLVFSYFFPPYQYGGLYNAALLSVDFQAASGNAILNATVKDMAEPEQLGGERKTEQDYGMAERPPPSPDSRGSTRNDDLLKLKQAGKEIENTGSKKSSITCNLANPRSDVCRLAGNVRIHGNSSSVVLVTSNDEATLNKNETWRLRPHARKGDTQLMEKFREIVIRPSNGPADAPACAVNHSIPAVIFALGGYNGNYYHDFIDVLVPLFITTRQFEGEVQFLITNILIWWLHKYERILKKLSRYAPIDLDKENQVHCFPSAIVGLEFHKDLTIDPARAPNGYSMHDFMKFMRMAYSLDRDSTTKLQENNERKLRLLIIARKHTRRLTNINEIIPMAEHLGYEVVIDEASFHTNVAQVARMVNSFDVMVGVHGAGLTNLVFLPTNAVLIQIVPFGGLEGMCQYDFGDPAVDAKLRYLQYNISEEESTLVDLYPRDHPIFKDPASIHKQGWFAMGEIYLVKQNIRLNVTRFRPVLLKALEFLS